MHIISQFLQDFSNFVLQKGYLLEISIAQIAIVLVIYGGEITKSFRKLLKPYHFVLRVTAFILLNVFGIGIATVFGGRLLALGYTYLDAVVRMPIVILMFILIGILAERKKQI